MSLDDRPLDDLSLNDKVVEMRRLVSALYPRSDSKTKFSDLKILLADHNQWFYCYIRKDGTPVSNYRLTRSPIYLLDEFYTVSRRESKYRRGSLLEFFSYLEILVNKTIQLHLIGFSSKHNNFLEDMFLYVNYARKLEILKKYNIVKNPQSNNLKRINEVRNQLAHTPDINSLYYKKNGLKLLKDVEDMEEFKEDLVHGYQDLISAYIKLETKHEKEIDCLIIKLRNNQG